jgi:hypothetical protein
MMSFRTRAAGEEPAFARSFDTAANTRFLGGKAASERHRFWGWRIYLTADD